MVRLALMPIENCPMIREETEASARLGIGEGTMRADLDEKGIAHANSQIWEQMLAMNLVAAASSEGFCIGEGHVRGSIQLSGAWTGLVEVRLAAGLANQATATMLMQSIESVSEEDILDAAKEIANMIAGVIKSLLPRPVRWRCRSLRSQARDSAVRQRRRIHWLWRFSIRPAI